MLTFVYIFYSLTLVWFACVTVQLGATLANHNKSEQAVQVYAKALNIRPTYARGWLNLGEGQNNARMKKRNC